MLHITEDTPADMLSGAMDLTIHLPSGRTVKMCVERSTPMMDLLVQITTKHQLQITNHTLQPLQTVPNAGHFETVLSYYPNTPIGTLDTQQIRVVPKTRSLLIPKNVPPGHQPFESTFRLKVHLPRNQLYVTRVSRHVYIEDIMKKVCEEKNLDEKKYEVRHPGNLDEVLDSKLTLNDYMITEIYMVLKGSNSLTQGFTSSDIMATKKEEDRKQTHNRNSGGVFNLIFRRGRSNTGSGTISTTANSTHSNNVGDFVAPETTVATKEPPTTVKVDVQREKPRPPQRKRRPAPKPPQKVEPEPREPSETRISTVNSDNSTGDSSVAKNESGVTICHSRHSSDSSGYHETSILSDNCNTSLPRRSRLEEGDVTGHVLSRRSESTGNLTKMSAQSRSTSSLAFPGRKKKTAPPPPKPLIKLSASSDTNSDKPSPVVASRIPSSSPPLRTESISSNGPSQNTQNKLDLILENSTDSITNQKEVTQDENNRTNDFCSISDTQKIDEQLNEIDTFSSYEKSSQDSGNSSDISEKSKLDEEFANVPIISDTRPDDEYEEWQLPSPPKAFKDCSPDIQKQTEMTEVDNVLNSELLEKLRKIEESEKTEYFLEDQVDIDNIGTKQDDKVILNKLSLENLEKRKSLVYNRELSTSFKAYDSETPNENNLVKKFLSDLDLKGSLNRSDKLDEKSSTARESSNQSTLPNFRITTYDEPKQKIKVFEDDTIRSSSQDTRKSLTLDRTKSLQKNFMGRSMENISMKPQYPEEKSVEHRIYNHKNHYTKKNINRTGSFSTYQNEWIPSKPITRSKSQVGVKRDERSNELQSGNLSKSNSLFDVSGLQSLEVMRKIQNKLNTPTASKETLAESEIEREHEKKEISEAEEVPLRKPQYTGPPSVNMSTWSERPKIPVCVKEDSDYKLGRGTNKTNFEITSNIQNVPLNNIVEIRHTSDSKINTFPHKTENENVTININGYEPIISQKNNVVIKIEQQTKRFQDFNTPFQYRAPLNSLNKNSPRPHSVAFSSDFDISRVPVVRSVELKKTYQETNNSNGNYQFSKSRYSSHDENAGNTTRPVFRTRSFLQPNPVVKGFRNFVSETKINNNETSITNRSSLTLPNPTSKNYSTNQSVPFSKFNLRRIESEKFNGENKIQTRISTAQMERNGSCSEYFKDEPKSNDFVPQQPQMPKLVPKKIVNRQFVPVLDPRDELLKSIRDFGGKKGLRSRKA